MARTSENTPVPMELPVAETAGPVRADAERNREKVLSAAAGLFADLGVENVSMDAIAAAAGVGKGTLFRRFGDRAGLAQALLQDQTMKLQDAMIRGPAPLGPGAPPRERLKALGGAQLTLLETHAELVFAGESGGSGRRFMSGAYQFLRVHVTLLLREADPELDAEPLADILLAPLSADTFLYFRRVREFDHERLVAAFESLVDRLLP
jgi:AcrR family transcriptional regulator